MEKTGRIVFHKSGHKPIVFVQNDCVIKKEVDRGIRDKLTPLEFEAEKLADRIFSIAEGAMASVIRTKLEADSKIERAVITKKFQVTVTDSSFENIEVSFTISELLDSDEIKAMMALMMPIGKTLRTELILNPDLKEEDVSDVITSAHKAGDKVSIELRKQTTKKEKGQ